MKILGIETSCDETAVALIKATGAETLPDFKVLSHALFSQASLHAEYGGVYPNLAKREHQKNLVPLLKQALKDAGMNQENETEEVALSAEQKVQLTEILTREPALLADIIPFLEHTSRPDIDIISVTQGPGLEPALWVGLNFAQALSYIWNIPLLPANHMEGHILSVLLNHKEEINFPALALLVSGGHTELIHIENWNSYEKIGQTLDDAAGEAFDKVARMLDLPYPGGPHISTLAEEDRTLRDEKDAHRFKLPRPMLTSKDFNFSYSGLKTAVLYKIRDRGTLTDTDKRELAREFEDSVTESLLRKTQRAIDELEIKTLIMAGGVIANKHIRETFQHECSDVTVLLPERDLATDNAVMIALVGFFHADKATLTQSDLKAHGNLAL